MTNTQKVEEIISDKKHKIAILQNAYAQTWRTREEKKHLEKGIIEYEKEIISLQILINK